MSSAQVLEKRSIRRAFDRAAPGYDQHAVLQREVGSRLLEHLDPIVLDPARIVDLGCGTGAAFEPLSKRYGRAALLGVDLAPAMLALAARRTPRWKRALGLSTPAVVCADAERLPLAPASVQLVHSNLALQWCRPELVFPEAARVLAPGGLFLFSTFGPDTLRELRESFRKADGGAHVHAFIDMHDLGDALIHAGFSDPVMEMDMVTLEYETAEAVARDLKAIGARNALAQRSRGLAGRGRWRRMAEHYEVHRRNGALPATYEVIYGHAWKVPPKKLADGRQVMEFRALMRGVFVTGTDTGVGKTVAACALVHALRARGARVVPMKPVAAGADRVDGRLANADSVALAQAAGWTLDALDDVTPVLLREPMAPHIAARREGVTIDRSPIRAAFARLAARGDFAVVEGVGGFLVPLGPGFDAADLARELALPVVLVVGLRLGCLNHALLTARAIAASGLPFAGWIANAIDPAMAAAEENLEALRERLGAPLLGHLPHAPGADALRLAAHLDVSPLLALPIPAR